MHLHLQGDGMKDVILLELARRWEADATIPETKDGSPEAEVSNAFAQGHRECKRECADTIRSLVAVLGEDV